MKELTTKGKFDERSIEKVREFMAEEASTLRSQIRAYELIYDFLGLEPPDEDYVSTQNPNIQVNFCNILKVI